MFNDSWFSLTLFLYLYNIIFNILSRIGGTRKQHREQPERLVGSLTEGYAKAGAGISSSFTLAVTAEYQDLKPIVSQ